MIVGKRKKGKAYRGTQGLHQSLRRQCQQGTPGHLAPEGIEDNSDRGPQAQFPEIPYIRFASRTRIGDKVLDTANLSKAYDTALFSDLSFPVRRHEKVAVIGTNGVGKTSLLKVLTGEEAPDTGSVRRGETVDISCFPQDPGEWLQSDTTILDWLSPFVEATTVSS